MSVLQLPISESLPASILSEIKIILRDRQEEQMKENTLIFFNMTCVCFGGFYGVPTQHMSYSSKDTFESVNYAKNDSDMTIQWCMNGFPRSHFLTLCHCHSCPIAY